MPREERTNIQIEEEQDTDTNSHGRFGFLRKFYKRSVEFLRERPLTTFFIAFALLFLILILGNITSAPKTEKTKQPQAKSVRTYSIGESPKVTFQAKIEKSGIVKIVAQAPGVVQKINVKAGDTVNKGTQILTLSSNYQGGNAPAIQAQMARTQYQNVLNTYDKQKSIIETQRNIATASAENASQQRDIARQSNDETKSLINSNQSQLDGMNQTLQLLQSAPPSASGSAQIQQTQSLVNQLQGGINQLRASQRSLELQSAGDKPPAQLAGFQQDLTLKQLELQEKTLSLNKEVSRLQTALAEVSEATMYPSSPFAGTVNRVYVHEGQVVGAGTLLASVSSPEPQAMAIVLVPSRIAKNTSRLTPSSLYLDGHAYQIRPSFVSEEATDGLLYSIFYTIPQDENIKLTDGDYVNAEIPVGMPSTGSTVPFVPIDAVFQSEEKAYLMVMKNNKAEVRTVILGSVFGSFVEITSGLKSGDQVILDRNVVAGDSVKNQ